MRKTIVTEQLLKQKVVAVLRGTSVDEVVEMAKRAIIGGIKIIEITMTTPFAWRAIELLKQNYDVSDDNKEFAVIGAGTVLDAETARLCILHGADFIVSPSIHAETIKMCHRYRVPIYPGVMTVNEAQTALEYGVDVVKLFPGDLYEPSVIKAIKGPIPYINIMPTGGVTLDNIDEWLTCGAVAVGIGSDLTRAASESGDWSLIEQRAKQYMDKVSPI